MPAQYIRDGLLVTLKSAGQHQNKIIDRQNWGQLMQYFQAYYACLMQLAMPLGDPRLIQVISQKGIVGANEAMRQLLETYDTRNIPRLLVTELEGILNGTQNGAGNPGNRLIGVGAGGNGNNGNNGTQQNAPMDLLSQIISAGGGR
jgi:hypothetical protein